MLHQISPGLLAATFLIGTFFLTALNSAFRSLRQRQAKVEIERLGNRFFYATLQNRIFPHNPLRLLYLSIISASSLTRFGFAASAIGYLSQEDLLPSGGAPWTASTIWLLLFLLGALIIGDLLPRLWGARFPKTSLSFAAPIASFFLVLFFPFSFLLQQASLNWWNRASKELEDAEGTRVQEQIIELISDAQNENKIDIEHRRLIESALTFRDRIVREVMVPRVNILGLSAETSIRDAARIMGEEGYSRAPVYEDNLDHITGIVLYKELLRVYVESMEQGKAENLDAPISTITSQPLYTPETRKISMMLQDFRRRQVHMAVVVDEYGGTEGVVTMEDLLEEIVGEIEDEYDTEENLFERQEDGSLIIDARMTILDIQQRLEISIPQETDYDTLGGYIFHRAGSIPTPGMVIHHDDFDLEILSSDERRVNKVKITPNLDG